MSVRLCVCLCLSLCPCLPVSPCAFSDVNPRLRQLRCITNRRGWNGTRSIVATHAHVLRMSLLTKPSQFLTQSLYWGMPGRDMLGCSAPASAMPFSWPTLPLGPLASTPATAPIIQIHCLPPHFFPILKQTDSACPEHPNSDFRTPNLETRLLQRSTDLVLMRWRVVDAQLAACLDLELHSKTFILPIPAFHPCKLTIYLIATLRDPKRYQHPKPMQWWLTLAVLLKVSRPTLRVLLLDQRLQLRLRRAQHRQQQRHDHWPAANTSHLRSHGF